jgi:hypothetical protein
MALNQRGDEPENSAGMSTLLSRIGKTIYFQMVNKISAPESGSQSGNRFLTSNLT